MAAFFNLQRPVTALVMPRGFVRQLRSGCQRNSCAGIGGQKPATRPSASTAANRDASFTRISVDTASNRLKTMGEFLGFGLLPQRHADSRVDVESLAHFVPDFS
jgi:hypothetical protein